MPKISQRLQPVASLVPVPREQYLLRTEADIRSKAHLLAKIDPAAERHLAAVLIAEDFQDIHESAAARYRRDAPHVAEAHDRYVAQAVQLRLHHLDQLAHLVL